MIVIFTDLDGTLLDQATCSFEAARPALELLKRLDVPLIFCTSKTRAEVEFWRARLGNRHPFIVENGGGLFVPCNYFPSPLQAPRYKDGYAVYEFGGPYSELVRTLNMASAESRCRVLGFHEMSIEEVSVRCGITRQEAILAKQREYDEPFEILGSGTSRLLQAIENRHKRWTLGGRFHHILGVNDKALCVDLLVRFYRRFFSDVMTVGLGDGLNDAAFLNVVDIPVLIQSAAIEKLKTAVPRGRLSERYGPEGWNTAMLDIFAENIPLLDQPWLASQGPAV